MSNVVFLRIDNIEEKEENAVYQHFLVFPLVQKAFSPVHQKSSLCGKGLKTGFLGK